MTAHGVSGEDLKKAIGHVSWKSHQNGAKNPKAHLQKAVEMETILNAPMIASPLGLFDCCGVSDGAAAAIVTTPGDRQGDGKQNIVSVKALQLSVSNGSESGHNSWDGSYFHTTRIASKKAYEEAGIKDPRKEVSMFEVHDCFSVTELVTMEDPAYLRAGQGLERRARRLLRRRRHDPLPDRRRAEVLRPSDRRLGPAHALRDVPAVPGPGRRAPAQGPEDRMTHNLGGAPRENVSSVAIVGRYE
jgi:acetyl-CoA C-acetyltransferase